MLKDEFTLPCGLTLPNRLCKAAMAEGMAPTHKLDDQILTAYKQWADGGWGMILTGNVQVSSKYLGSPDDISFISKSSSPSPGEKEIWKQYADACQRSGTPAVVQICHPGRQSPLGAGDRGFFEKTIAPSAVKLHFGDSLIERLAVTSVFGTPRAMTEEEIHGPDSLVESFVEGARQCYEAGFKGVQLHGAHGYMLAQFLSPQTNLRTDSFGGSPAKRAEVVLQIIRATRAATSPSFCIGIKMNSVDASGSDSLADTMEQIRLIVDAGIDFIEISGGSYENPRMMMESNPNPNGADSNPASATTTSKPSARTAQRESFFLEFAQTVRETFPSVALMVTGGFRTRFGMEEAVKSGNCDLVGIGRPAAVLPALPKEIILNEKVEDVDANLTLKPVEVPRLVSMIPVKQMGAGVTSQYYSSQIQRMGRGEQPVDTRVNVAN